MDLHLDVFHFISVLCLGGHGSPCPSSHSHRWCIRSPSPPARVSGIQRGSAGSHTLYTGEPWSLSPAGLASKLGLLGRPG